MQSVQEYLAFDMASNSVDEPVMMLVTACASLFEGFEELLRESRLSDVELACDAVACECEQVLQMVRGREEAAAELRHYEEKLSTILPFEKDKLARNVEKRDRAREVAQERQQTCEEALHAFANRRPAHTRVTLHALLGAGAGVKAPLWFPVALCSRTACGRWACSPPLPRGSCTLWPTSWRSGAWRTWSPLLGGSWMLATRR